MLPTQSNSSEQLERGAPSPSTPAPRFERFRATTLSKSPFTVLGVSLHDNRRRIVEVAEEKSLELDQELCQKARSDLTNPRTRLSAELAWFPGVAPREVDPMLNWLLLSPHEIARLNWLPKLSRLNFMASAMELMDVNHDTGDMAKFIHEIADLADQLQPEEELRLINEDRAVSCFSPVKSVDLIEEGLSERRRFYRNTIKNALDRLSSTKLVQLMTVTVANATANGGRQAPSLIDDLVDSYELETQSALLSGAEAIRKLIKSANDWAPRGEGAVQPYVEKIKAALGNWSRIAQPIKILAKARGADHKLSSKLGWEIRSLSIDLWNKHDFLVPAQTLAALLQDWYCDHPAISERVKQDIKTFDGISLKRKQAAARRDEQAAAAQRDAQAAARSNALAHAVSYSAEIGLISKETLSISPNGISWRGQHFPLESITHVRWGGISQSINGIPIGTKYTIAFGNKNFEAVVKLRKKHIYSTFIDHLWHAVCVRILTLLLIELREGRDLYFGCSAIVHDDGISLQKFKLIGQNEWVRFTWNQVKVWSFNGSFCMEGTNTKTLSISLSYLDYYNIHILEQAILMARKKYGMRRLSELLQ